VQRITGHALVSVVVYCDGVDAHIERTLAALASQTLSGLEVVLAGRAPTGTTCSAVQSTRLLPESEIAELLQADVRAGVVESTHGACFVEFAAGDEPAPTMLEKCAWALRTRPNTAAVAVTAGPPDPLGAGEDVRVNGRGTRLTEFRRGSYMVNRSAWDETGGFAHDVPSELVDRDWCLTALERGFAITPLIDDLVSLREAQSPIERDGADAWLRERHPAAYRRSARGRRARDRWSRLSSRSAVLRNAGSRIGAKLAGEGLLDAGASERRRLRSVLRLLPNRLKGAWWHQRGLPDYAVDMWEEAPRLTGLPDGGDLSVAVPADGRRTQVLILHPYLVTGGAETVVLNLLSSIDRRRFEVHLVTTEGGPFAAPWMRDPWLPDFAAQCDSIFRLPVFLERGYFLRFLVEFVASRKIDVFLNSISVFGYRALPALSEARPGMAIVDLLHAEAPYAPLDQITLAREYREYLDLRVVTTETVRLAQVEKYGAHPDRLVVIPNSVDTEGRFDPSRYPLGAFRESLGIGTDVTLVLFFGRIVSEKQPDHIVRVAQLLSGRSDIIFAVVGEGVEQPSLVRTIAERGLPNVVVVPPLENVAVAIADADCVFFPSKREGLPMSGLEALSMATPVIASNVPGWSDLIEDGRDGFLVTDGDFEGYARAIARIADEPGLKARMSEASREKAVTRYGTIPFARAWERVFDRAMEVHRA